ncbi:MAG: hypothetical protein QOD10_5026, partial [Mycobacterium sp.]|nr:hypothetical protein [Mycobacterium sp.]
MMLLRSGTMENVSVTQPSPMARIDLR